MQHLRLRRVFTFAGAVVGSRSGIAPIAAALGENVAENSSDVAACYSRWLNHLARI
jgi:hypothetical protein